MARAGASFEMLGLGGFLADVDALRDDVRATLEGAVDTTTRNVQRRARSHVPRDRGDLANAIQTAGRGLSRSVGLADASVPSRGGRNSAHLNPWVYGLWVEIGLKHNPNYPKQPYMGPAVDQEEPFHVERCEQALNGAIG